MQTNLYKVHYLCIDTKKFVVVKQDMFTTTNFLESILLYCALKCVFISKSKTVNSILIHVLCYFQSVGAV